MHLIGHPPLGDLVADIGERARVKRLATGICSINVPANPQKSDEVHDVPGQNGFDERPSSRGALPFRR